MLVRTTSGGLINSERRKHQNPPDQSFRAGGESRMTPPATSISSQVRPRISFLRQPELWVANYYSARNPLRLSSLVILGVVARMFRCATRSSCWCT